MSDGIFITTTNLCADTTSSLTSLFVFHVAQYVNKAASTIRGALKEPAKRQAMANESLSYNSSAWTAGEQGAKSPVTTVAQAGK